MRSRFPAGKGTYLNQIHCAKHSGTYRPEEAHPGMFGASSSQEETEDSPATKGSHAKYFRAINKLIRIAERFSHKHWCFRRTGATMFHYTEWSVDYAIACLKKGRGNDSKKADAVIYALETCEKIRASKQMQIKE
jgi:hypothetical protein